MEKKIHLKVLTNEGVALDSEVSDVVAPGEKGSFGMLYNHAALITTLDPGVLRWHTLQGEERRASVGGGLLEVEHNNVTLLVSHYTPQQVARSNF